VSRVIENELVDNIVKRVYALRLQYGWTMHELEDRCGFAHGYQSRMESRKKGFKKLSVLTCLTYADAFAVDVGWLITGRTPNPKRAPKLTLVDVPPTKPFGPQPR
jgi:transcriptional regulator with XRE-family HTH domain